MFKTDATTVDNDAPRENGGFVARVLNSMSNKKQKVSGYRSVNHVSTTGNICERTFSTSKLVLTDQRGSMDPSTLEEELRKMRTRKPS